MSSRPQIVIAPSLLSADFARLGEQVGLIERGGAEWLHLDVMDGHFVANLTIGPVVVEKLRPVSGLFFDTHLMLADPLRYVEPFARAGSDLITFHVEATDSPGRVIERIRGLGKQVGVSLKPGTGVADVRELLEAVDLVLVMTVEPGFGGQEFIPETLEKIAALRELLGPEQRLEVDGGINGKTTAQVVRAGADTLVAGSAVFSAKDPVAEIAHLRGIAHQARSEVSMAE